MKKRSLEYGNFLNKVFNLGDRKIRNITFQVTDNCSLRCTYCYQHNKGNHKMNFETAKKFIDFIFQNRKNEKSFFGEKETAGFIFEFIGGEPLLEINLISQICEYIEEKMYEIKDESDWFFNHIYNFSSNGVAYFEPDVQNYLKKFRYNANLNITIDGCKELHDKCRLFPDGTGSYDLAIQAALAELKRGNDQTKITLSPNNIEYLYKGFSNMIELGFYEINANCAFEEGWTKQNANQLYQELKKIAYYIKENNLQDQIYFALLDENKYLPLGKSDLDSNWCGSNFNMLALDYKGDIYPCLRFMESSIGNDLEPIILGNVERGFLTLPKEQKHYCDLKKCTKLTKCEKKCLDCPIASGCAWCSGYDYEIYKELNCPRTTYICDMQKAQAFATKFYCKLIGDKISFNKINIPFSYGKDILLSDEEINKIFSWEG